MVSSVDPILASELAPLPQAEQGQPARMSLAEGEMVAPEAANAGLDLAHASAATAVASANQYTRQLRQRQRAAGAARQVETLTGLRRNAQTAAFESLMRMPRPPGGALAASAPSGERSRSLTPAPAVTAAFEQAVAARLDAASSAAGPSRLAHADRRVLLREAASLGISRFDAALLMARVQHYHAQADLRRPASPPRPRRRRRKARGASRSLRRTLLAWGGVATVLLIVQAVFIFLWLRLFQP